LIVLPILDYQLDSYMREIKTHFCTLLLVLIFFSCEKVVPIEDGILKSKLVVNSVFLNDSFCQLHLSSSLNIYNTNTFKNILDASVFIKDSNGNNVEHLPHVSNGFYAGNQLLAKGKSYYLQVEHSNFNSVFASSSIPNSISNIYIDTSSYTQNGKDRIKVRLTFEDERYVNNYYKLAVKVGKTLTDSIIVNGSLIVDTSKAYSWLKIYKDHSILESTITNKETIFNDNTFNGSNFSIDFSIKDIIKKINNTDNINLDFIELYFYNINSSLYNYHKSINNYSDNNSNPFAQPIQVFSNIQNGFGIFSGANLNVVKLY
tara:strand:- start:1159 stop:2109 length:951 start_codon:yes stop_codon:yes gene_type:complete